jgi:hypothetical protein
LGSVEGGREGLVRFFIEVEEGAPKPAAVPEPQASLGRT